MKVADFINLFKTGGLGKKRQHTGYKVMDGEHCQLLVRSTRRWGVPGGSELIGIYFGSDVCLFHNNFYKLRNSVTECVHHPKPIITGSILKSSDEHLINSGIIGFDEDKGVMLIEIGDTPWLFEQDNKYTPTNYADWKWHYNSGTQISKRVGTVAEALNDVVLPDNVVSRLGYLLKVMPSDFAPITTSEEDIKLLMNPPNPFNYGLTLDDCVVQTVYGSKGLGCHPLIVKRSVASSSRGAQFRADSVAYNGALERFDGRSPGHWEDIQEDESNGSLLIGVNKQVYLKGQVHNRFNANTEKDNFKTWVQVMGKTTKIRLPVR